MSDPPGDRSRTTDAARRATQRLRTSVRRYDADSPATDPKPPQQPASVAKQSKRQPPKNDRGARAYARVARRVLGEQPPAEGSRPDVALSRSAEIAQQALRQRALATFAEQVAQGRPMASAHAVAARALVDAKLRHEARALTLGLELLPEGDRIRAVGLGQVLFGMNLFELAWTQFGTLDTETLAKHVPVEAATCALSVGTPDAVAVATAIGDRASQHDPETLAELAGRFVATDHADLARALVDEIARREPGDVSVRAAGIVANLRRWTHPLPIEQPQPGAVSIGVIDYHQPDVDRASRNVGDYVQTLAMLGNLARFQQARFAGADGLGDLATSLQSRVKPRLTREAGAADVHLMPVSRDFSHGDDIPPSTWMVAFGWHMHSMFRLRFGLPYHPNINPIFVSFHINRVSTLTPETVNYLREHGPIGCRDWTTVYLLLSAGVDAFFTGCLTTTVDAVFPDLEDVQREQPGVVAVIDLPLSVAKKAKRSVETLTHGAMEYREAGLVEGTRAAIDLLTDYQRRFYRIFTSRLHSYLPATSLGVKVSFQPKVPGDVRFDGLWGMEPGLPAFTAMQDGIRQLIANVFDPILDGADKAAVYDHWREITAERVVEAKARWSAPPPEIEPLDITGDVAQIRARMRRYGPHDSVDEAAVTDVSMSLDENFRALLPVTVESMLANATGPVRLWVTARGLSEDYEAWFGRSFPDLPVTFLNFDGVDYGEIGRMIRHISIATMDRLLLPELLPELQRIVYIDIDTVTTGDVCELARIDLRGTPLAARTSVYSGALQWRLAGDLISPERAAELRRTLSFRHPFDFLTFNAGVIVLDLARMRADNFTGTFVPMAGRYGLNDQDLLNAYVGADRAELDPRWNALPVQENISSTGIVHYAGAGKPWNDLLVPYGDLWKQYATRVSERIGSPPE